MEYAVPMIVKTDGPGVIVSDQRRESMGGLAKGLRIIEGFSSREFMSIAVRPACPAQLAPPPAVVC